jgi:hypothetical protein
MLSAQPSREKPTKLRVKVTNAVTKGVIPNATVRVTQPAQTAVTDATGWAEFAVAPGTYRIAATAPGYFSEGVASEEIFKVEPDRLNESTGVNLSPLATISGQVRDENDDPIAGAKVLLGKPDFTWGKPFLAQVQSTSTDARGLFRIAELRPGTYILRSAPDQLPPDATGYGARYYPNSRDLAGAQRIQIKAGDNLTSLDFRWSKEPVYQVRGRLTGQTLARQPITLHSCPQTMETIPMFLTTAYANENGSFETKRVPAGTYCLNYDEKATGYSAQRLVTITDRDLNDVELKAEAPVTLSGNLTGAGAARPLLLIRPVDERRSPLTGQITLTSDTFSVRLAPGNYEFQVAPGIDHHLKTLKLNDEEVRDHRLRLTGESAKLTVQLDEGKGEVTGTVQGAPEQNERIGLILLPAEPGKQNWEDLVRSGTAFGRNAFRMTKVPPGIYTLYAWQGGGLGAREQDVLRQFPGITVTVKDGEVTTAQPKLILAEQYEAMLAKAMDLR